MLVAGFTVLCAVCVFNTALLIAVIRRMRVHAELLSDVEERGVPARAHPVGEAVRSFEARDIEGLALSAPSWPGPTLVGFFSPTCSSCRRERKHFRAVAARWPGGRSHVVAVVSGPAAAAAFLAQAGPVARIVVDRQETVREAFGVRSFPAAFVVTRTGRISWSGLHVPAPETVPELVREAAERAPVPH